MSRLVYRPDHPQASENGMVDVSLVFEACENNAPYVISDTMDLTRHMANGLHYTSKSEFRKATRAAGCVEVGTETKTITAPRKPVVMDRRKRVDDIKRTIHELRNKRK